MFDGACSPRISGACSTGTLDCGDTVPPVVTLYGDSFMTHEAASGEFLDPWVLAWDDRDANVTHTVTRTGNVNPHVLGNYTLVYNAWDRRDNVGTAIRVVEVQGASHMHYSDVRFHCACTHRRVCHRRYNSSRCFTPWRHEPDGGRHRCVKHLR